MKLTLALALLFLTLAASVGQSQVNPGSGTTSGSSTSGYPGTTSSYGTPNSNINASPGAINAMESANSYHNVPGENPASSTGTGLNSANRSTTAVPAMGSSANSPITGSTTNANGATTYSTGTINPGVSSTNVVVPGTGDATNPGTNTMPANR